jgi:hypothetical protein
MRFPWENALLDDPVDRRVVMTWPPSSRRTSFRSPPSFTSSSRRSFITSA